jgi:hypothetical protein
MTSTLPAATLADYSDTELATFYNASEAGEWHTLLEAEMTRRDAADADARARRAAHARYITTGAGAAWYEAAHAQFLAAETACAGRLLSADGMAETSEPMTLWTGTDKWARRLASEELRNWWDIHPRLTVSEYQRQAGGERRAWTDRHDREAVSNDYVGEHAASSVRRIADERQSAGVRGDSRGDDVPGFAARRGAEARQAGGAAAGAGRVVQRAGMTGTATDRDWLRQRAAGVRDLAAQETPGQPERDDEQPAQVTGARSGGGAAEGVVAVREGGTVTSAAAQRAALIIAESLLYAKRILTRHVAWPSPAALDTVLLWILHANARDRDDAGYGPLIWRASPRLLLTSAARGSGKSTGLDLIGMLTGNSGRPSKITPRAIAHKLANKHETVTLDEAKLMFGSGNASRELQGVLLTGYTRRGTYSYSSGGKDVDLKTFGAVAYAGKDELITDTSGLLGDLLDRSITIRMRRAGRHYPDIDDAADAGAELACRGMATWATIMQGELAAASSRLSREASEAGTLAASDVEAGQLRVTQIWRPRLACADVLGGDWPARARAAAAAGDAETEEWLADLHELDGELWDDAGEDDLL